MKNLALICLLIILFGSWKLCLGQNITGTTSNICPLGYYKYYAASTCPTSAWSCSGCTSTSVDKTGAIINTGGDSDGRQWAIVQWDNSSSGSIGNICGTLNVNILYTEPPTITANKNGLCGSGQITFTAHNSSTANITGYAWGVIGTGLSIANGSTTTTANTLTLNYSNWTPSSSTVQVGVGALNAACNNYNTGVQPIGGSVTIVPGNTNNLQISFNFSPTTVCSNPTMRITNQPSNTYVNWSSSNTSALNFTNASTGAATIVNNYQGGVTVTAEVGNDCGSNTQSKNIWIGPPINPPLISGPTTVTASTDNYYSAYVGYGDPPFADQGIAESGFVWSFPLTQTNAGWNCGGCLGSSIDVFSGSASTYVSLQVNNACGYSPRKDYEVFVQQDCPPEGCPEPFVVIYPNPSDKTLTIKTQSFSKSESTVSISIVNEQDQTMYQNTVTGGTEVNVQVTDWQKGTYYLKMSDGKKDRKQRLIINH